MAIADILVPGAKMWYAPYGTAIPSANTVAFGASWSSWTAIGELSTPVTFNYSDQMVNLNVQSTPAEIGAFRSEESLVASGALSEYTGTNLSVLFAGSLQTVNAGAGQKAISTVAGGGQTLLTYYTVGFEGFRADTTATKQPVRVHLLRCHMRIGGAMVMGKNNVMVTPFSVKAFGDTTEAIGAQLFRIYIVTAPATS